jgi:hypothetical protein
MLSKKYCIAMAILAGYSAFVQAVTGEVILGTVSNKTDKPIEIGAAQEKPAPSGHRLVTVQPGETVNVRQPIPISSSIISPGTTMTNRLLLIQSRPAKEEPLRLEFTRTTIAGLNEGQTTLVSLAELKRHGQVIGDPWHIPVEFTTLRPGQEDSYSLDITLAGQNLMESDIDVTTSISG